MDEYLEKPARRIIDITFVACSIVNLPCKYDFVKLFIPFDAIILANKIQKFRCRKCKATDLNARCITDRETEKHTISILRYFSH